MIQRIQTVYLFCAALLSAVCVFLPLGTFVNGDVSTELTCNMFAEEMTSGRTLAAVILFLILFHSAMFSVLTIFAYRNRKSQMLFCRAIAGLLACWYIVYFVFAHVLADETATFSPSLGAILPALSIVFILLALRGIKADEKLVRAADRIR